MRKSTRAAKIGVLIGLIGFGAALASYLMTGSRFYLLSMLIWLLMAGFFWFVNRGAAR